MADLENLEKRISDLEAATKRYVIALISVAVCLMAGILTLWVNKGAIDSAHSRSIKLLSTRVQELSDGKSGDKPSMPKDQQPQESSN